jgi:KDO2-lipid IV(A) lauroyltransferase
MASRLKKMRRALRRPFESGGYRLAGWLIPRLPRSALLALARGAGKWMSRFSPRLKKLGMTNLDAVFGDTKTPEEKTEILQTSFSTFALTMLDLLWFTRHTSERIQKYVHLDPSLEQFFVHDKGFVCITAHLGNWEVISQIAALQGIEIAAIAATIKNKAVNQLLIQQREKSGQTIIPREGALRTLISRLRKNGKVAFLLDQNTPEKQGGIEISFMGFPTPISSAPAMLAYRTGSEIVFGFCTPQSDGSYLINSPGSIQPPPFEKGKDAEEITRKLTQEIVGQIEAEIRRHPQHWLWAYKHWRRKPQKEYPANYPRY